MEKQRQYERVFNHMDENGDGKISASELQRCVSAMGGEMSGEEAEAAVRMMDTDGDGVVSLEDLVKIVEGSGGSRSEEERRKDLRGAFKMYEMSPEGSGYINPESLKRMLRRLGESNVSITQCKHMIARFDLNGDGLLSFDEFHNMMML